MAWLIDKQNKNFVEKTLFYKSIECVRLNHRRFGVDDDSLPWNGRYCPRPATVDILIGKLPEK